MYAPPFHITSRIIDLISRISEKIGEINLFANSPRHLELRKENRIRTIHSSLAIENNTLSLEQMTAIVQGKRVLGAPNEIQEVKNAVQAYNLLLKLNPYNEHDLLNAHRLMMKDLVVRNGCYRTIGVGIFDGRRMIHVAPSAEMVPRLMADLFEWLRISDIHPLIKSCVFHYEFEFIHPFADGNGRMGRLWQTAILKEWHAVFAWLPVETLIKEHQADYYRALVASDNVGESTAFIEFMLTLILNTIEEIIKSQKKVTAKVTVRVTVNQQKIIDIVKENPFVTQAALAERLNLTRKTIVSNMKKLQTNGLIRRIGADKNGHWEVVN